MDWLEATCLAEDFWENLLEETKAPEAFPRLIIPATDLKEDPRPRISGRHWGLSDDIRLRTLVDNYDSNWTKIAEHFPGHSAEALQTRWVNKLDPQIKRSRWTTQEDELIMKLYEEHGGNWKLLAQRLHGRPPNAIKTRFYGSLCRVGRSKSVGSAARRRTPISRAKSVHAEESVAGELERLDAEWVQQLSKDISTMDATELSQEERQERLNDLTAKMDSVEKLLKKAETKIRGITRP
jgi:hypothetical protein